MSAHIMDLATAERTDLADLLATLTPQQWEAPTLCGAWRVRDVVAHMFSYEGVSFTGILGRALRGGLRLNQVNDIGVTIYADHTPEQLLALARAHLRPSGLTTLRGGRIGLTDALIHHQDIRRPLGLPWEIPAERLVTVLEFARTAPPLGAPKRVRGLTLVATDVDWSAGSGPVVEGPGEPLLMAMAGRRGFVELLSGPGQPILAARP